MALSCHLVRHVVGPAPIPASAPDLRACVIVATALPPAGRPWPKAEIEAALEEVAALLEGEGDQELVIRGTGEDGDICLDLLEIEAHESLRDQRSWVRTGFPPPPRRQEIALRLELEGSQADAQQAAAALLGELGRWLTVKHVTMSWGRPDATPVGWAQAESRPGLGLGR